MTPGETASDFVESLREGSIISPKAYADRMQLSLARLAELADVPLQAVMLEAHSDELQDYMRGAVSVIAALLELNGGNVDRAISWFRNAPLEELGGGTAESFVASGKAKLARDYVRNLAAGATG